MMDKLSNKDIETNGSNTKSCDGLFIDFDFSKLKFSNNYMVLMEIFHLKIFDINQIMDKIFFLLNY